MPLTFTPEQEELRNVVRQFLGQVLRRGAGARADGDRRGLRPRACGSRWPSSSACRPIAIPEEYGGSGFGFVELVVVLEEMGRALLCAPFFSTVVLAANTLLAVG